jgi:hypothetical protein
MPDVIVIIRIALLATAAMQLAVATVFFKAIQTRFVQPMLRSAEGQGRSVPRAMRWYFTSRVPALAMTAIQVGLAWFIGTPAGAALLDELRKGS